MFAAPPEQSLECEAGSRAVALPASGGRSCKDMSPTARRGARSASLTAEQRTLRRQLHETIQKVGDDYGRRHSFNTAIAAVMELLNHVAKFSDSSSNGRALRQEVFEAIVLLLNPITPHVSHALRQALGHAETC